MYVGVTYDVNSVYRDTTPAISTRSLKRGTLFLAEQLQSKRMELFIESKYRESYPINYVYGFSSGIYAFFMTTQLKHTSPDAPKEYITKLVRTCVIGDDYTSYTEIPVDCLKEGIKYNLVQAAYLGRSGSIFAKDLGINEDEDVLYAVFSEGIDNTPSNKSALLCVFIADY